MKKILLFIFIFCFSATNYIVSAQSGPDIFIRDSSIEYYGGNSIEAIVATICNYGDELIDSKGEINMVLFEKGVQKNIKYEHKFFISPGNCEFIKKSIEDLKETNSDIDYTYLEKGTIEFITNTQESNIDNNKLEISNFKKIRFSGPDLYIKDVKLTQNSDYSNTNISLDLCNKGDYLNSSGRFEIILNDGNIATRVFSNIELQNGECKNYEIDGKDFRAYKSGHFITLEYKIYNGMIMIDSLTNSIDDTDYGNNSFDFVVNNDLSDIEKTDKDLFIKEFEIVKDSYNSIDGMNIQICNGVENYVKGKLNIVVSKYSKDYNLNNVKILLNLNKDVYIVKDDCVKYEFDKEEIKNLGIELTNIDLIKMYFEYDTGKISYKSNLYKANIKYNYKSIKNNCELKNNFIDLLDKKINSLDDGKKVKWIGKLIDKIEILLVRNNLSDKNKKVLIGLHSCLKGYIDAYGDLLDKEESLND